MASQENIIRGGCPHFVCRFCRTKCGWAHQPWCDTPLLLEPSCRDCRYFRGRCKHPAYHRKRRGFADGKAEYPL